MEMTKLSLAEQLKTEIMERYNLREDQVHLELSISTINLDLGRQILADFHKYKTHDKEIYLAGYNQNCDSVFGKDITYISVHRKDGQYGQYLFDDEL